MAGGNVGRNLRHLLLNVKANHQQRANQVANHRHAHKAPLEESLQRRGLGDNISGRGRGNVAQPTDTGQQNRLRRTGRNRDDNAVHRCREAVGAVAVLPLDVVQRLGQLRGHNIAWQCADGLDDQTAQNNAHIAAAQQHNQ